MSVTEALSKEPQNTYVLPLARDYVRHWDMPKAVQELLQNAIDSDSPFEHSFEQDKAGGVSLSIHSRLASLSPSTLVLGVTSKADDDTKIGSFGEGYKIALLVLTRLGYPVKVFNNGVIWSPVFMSSAQFGVDVLAIEEYDFPHCQGLSFVIGNLTDEDVTAVTSTCLAMQDPIIVGEKYDSHHGEILIDQPGKLYVNGLKVCDTELTFGYNVKPAYLQLERDRQTVNSFDLQWIAKEMWFATKKYDAIAEMISDGVPDLKYAQHGCPELLKEACYKHFIENNPDGVIAKNPDELKELVSRGMERVVYINETLHACVSSSKSYTPTLQRTKAPMPKDAMQAWFDANRKYMSRLPIVSFKKLLSAAEKWRLS